ncbi:NUDIX domain-containing protein [Amycolatopsis roodepoortensis]|uniref:8-oxo-dGTP diphosphatase n=1 Tax=Amycolatopsis roodepoortensis TaxID=700274 RepID=A0ABR9LID8_9PSEU|nr:NUDIX hydrolase [Amycolatopsis roodepoortensis]MBE1580460.1 8-oxo-dGTP diphosphatase [Amycolatopsis roodepoortensis]
MSASPEATATRYTADMVLFTERGGVLMVLLIDRRWDPYQGKAALPGGHRDPGESDERAARRECREETGIDAPQELIQVGVYNERGRDPRGDYSTTAFSAVLPDAPDPVPDSDAEAAAWRPVHEVLEGDRLAFDHRRILTDAVAAQRHNIAALLNIQH